MNKILLKTRVHIYLHRVGNVFGILMKSTLVITFAASSKTGEYLFLALFHTQFHCTQQKLTQNIEAQHK